jgi:hypothetical protein
MKFLRFVLPASIPVLILAGHAVTACGGSSSSSPPNGGTNQQNNPDATTSGGGEDSGTPGQTTGSDDAGAGSMGAADTSIPIPDGGYVLPPVEAGSVGTVLPNGPGSVTCGADTCELDASTCCANTDGGASCAAGTTATCPQATIHCAEAADCPSGQLCCGVVDITNQSLQASCSTKACLTDKDTPPGAQLCAMGTSECPAGNPCTKQSCQGETVQLCGLFDYSFPGIITIKCVAE